MNQDPQLSQAIPMEKPVTEYFSEIGIGDQTSFNKEIEQLVRDEPGRLGVVIVDVNQLRRLNKEQGRLEGDKLLKRIGRVLKDGTRSKDEDYQVDQRHSEAPQKDGVSLLATASHLSGDEFGIVLRGVDSEMQIEAWISRTRATLDSEGLSASFGGKVHEPSQSAAELVDTADGLMQSDKKARKTEKLSSKQRRAWRLLGKIATTYNLDLNDASVVVGAVADTEEE